MVEVLLLVPTMRGVSRTEIAMTSFDDQSVIDVICERYGNEILPDDLEVVARDKYITVSASGIHTNSGDITVVFVGDRKDWTGN